ncbi:MAG: KAP family NTPase [Deltaproteobacteria bacterium]|jgi:hypothetical protein|nr:KAP family NTPase [Deltaproteobacteria bacterium]
MNKIGLCDVPVEKKTEESLGLTKYASAVTEFIKKCQSPMTIALQGDWGSGKTSLMNLIREELSATPDSFKIVWINTWLYSQFQLENELSSSLLNRFLTSLEADDETMDILDKVTSKLRSGVRKITSFVSKGAEVVGGVSALSVKLAADGINRLLPQQSDQSELEAIDILKIKLVEVVKKEIGDNNEKKIVVFIDDLDRLPPIRAVELLEAFKVFLDIPGCVYILACDYQVISQGLKSKFGFESEMLKGKHFFDKIIQLPFQMPVTQYDINCYLSLLLENIGIELTNDQDISIYNKLVEYSIGFNPRSLKRAFNCSLLLSIVAEKEGFFDDKLYKFAKKSEMQRIIFAIVCLQKSYENLYNFLCKYDKINDKFLKSLLNTETYTDNKNNKVLSESFLTMQKESPDFNADKLSSFMGAFYEAIQLDSDGDQNVVSKSELDIFLTLLSFSSVTSLVDNVSVENNIHKINREISKSLVNYLNNNYSQAVSKIFKASEFNLRPPRGRSTQFYVAANIKTRGSSEPEFGFWLKEDSYQFYFHQFTHFNIDSLKVYFKHKLSAKYTDSFFCEYEDESKEYFLLLDGTFSNEDGNIFNKRLEFLKKAANDIFDALLAFNG